jgi:uncharacterized membrane protein YjjP (DUF1212 family)
VARRTIDNPANKATDFIVRLGSALVATGAPVDLVEEILKDVSDRYGVTVGYSILPTGLIVLGHEGTSIVASIASSDPATLRFDQTADLFQLVDDVRAGQVDPAQGIERLTTIDDEGRQAGFLLTVLGHAVLTVGLALLLNPSWRSVGVCAVLGLLVGLMKLAAAPHRTLVKLLPAVTAFLVALCVLLLRRHGAGVDEPQAMIPPLVTFLPGAMLTVGALELAEGSIVTGSSRLVAGMMQLALLVFGIVVAAGLAQVPESAGLLSGEAPRVGAWSPWLGVALFGVGSALFFSARARAYPALLAVLYVAFAAQYLTKGFLGGYLSSFLGAAAAVLVASYIHRHLHGPPFLVTFLPAFWLLVPGVLSLIGVARIAVGKVAAEEFTVALFTILAIALGVIGALGIDRGLMKRFAWW